MPAFGVSNDIKTYEVVAYDKAGNESTKTFTIDSKKPIVVVNDTEYTGEESGNNFIDIGRFDSVNVNILEENIKYVNIWYNGVLQEDYLNVDYIQEGTYQIEVRDEFSNKTKIEFYVGKYDSKIVFSGLDNIVYDGNPVDDITVDVVDSEGKKVEQPILVNYYKDSYGEGNLLTGAPTDAGTYVIAAYYQKDNGDYEIAWASAEFTIKQATPTIELTEPDNLYFDETQKEYGIKVIGVNGEIEGPRMNVVYKDRVTGEDLETAPTKIGKYTLGIYVGPSQNYTRADKWINFEIVENPDHVTKFNKPLESGETYYSNIPYDMYDEDGIMGLYFDLDGDENGKSYATCEDLIAAVGNITTSTIEGFYAVNNKSFKSDYPVPGDYNGTVSVCVEDVYGNRVFFNNISIYKSNPNKLTYGTEGVIENINN